LHGELRLPSTCVEEWPRRKIYAARMMTYALLALLAGAAIGLQAALNASLGRQLGSPLFATVVAFASGLAFAALAALWYARSVAGPVLRDIPVYLWFTGGLLGAVALACFYWLIPRVGIGTTLSFTLTGQLALAMIAGHFGWFSLPQTPLSLLRCTGAAFLVVGLLLVNRG
jgi:transporter family-2 protein